MVIHVFLILGYNYAEAGNPLPIIINTSLPQTSNLFCILKVSMPNVTTLLDAKSVPAAKAGLICPTRNTTYRPQRPE
jgi:hypothetical protein